MVCITSPFLYTLHLKVCLDGREQIGAPPSEAKNNIFGFDVRTTENHAKPRRNPMTKLIKMPTILVHPCIILLIALEECLYKLTSNDSPDLKTLPLFKFHIVAIYM